MKTKDFIETYYTNREETRSIKWDALQERFQDPDLLPMWVADMEFKGPKAIEDALIKRAKHNIYGYSYTPDSYYDAFFNWQKKQHNITLEKDWIIFGTGVVNSLYQFVNVFTKVGDAIIIQTPVYYPFHNAIKDNNRKLVTSELVNTNGIYTMDYIDFEEKIIKNNVKLFILCNPHNPIGRVWKEEELVKLFEICRKHNVIVVSDEIHQDIILNGHTFTSAINVANGAYHDNLVVCTAPSKTFNLPSLLNSHVIIPNEELRKHFDAEIHKFSHTTISIMGQLATEAAYADGEEWFKGLMGVIEENYVMVKKMFEELPNVVISPLEGTYLLWIDLRGCIDKSKTKEVVQDKAKVAVDFGEWFGLHSQGFIRLNLATSPKRVETAVHQIIHAIQSTQ